jgi:hypothetical protein
VHVRGRAPAADAQLGSDLGGDGLPVIDTPKVVLTAGDPQPAQAEPAHRHQPTGDRDPLGPLRITHDVEQTVIV